MSDACRCAAPRFSLTPLAFGRVLVLFSCLISLFKATVTHKAEERGENKRDGIDFHVSVYDGQPCLRNGGIHRGNLSYGTG